MDYNESPRELLFKALNTAEKKAGENLLEFLCIKAYSNDRIALKILDKIVPSLSSQEVKSENDINISIKDLIRGSRKSNNDAQNTDE